MRKRVFLLGLLFLVGLSVLLYPLVSSEWNRHRSDAMIDSYTQTVAQAPAEEQSAWVDRARQYNATLEGKHFPDAFANITREESAEYLRQLDFDANGVMAYISIPRIDVSLPIYHGTAPETLERGAGHLEGSALPVGGAGTHCVISAHRGLPSATMFTDLDQLRLGDHFYLYVLDQVLAYQVDQILVVEPDEMEALNRQDGADYTTLVTCTPYGVNTQRLLVRGHRVAYEPETEQQEAQQAVRSLHTNYVLWVAVGLAVTLAFILVMWRSQRAKGGRLPRGKRERRSL